MRRRVALAVALSVLAAACTSSTSSPAPTTPVGTVTAPIVTAAATAIPTEAVIATPASVGKLELGKIAVLAWKPAGGAGTSFQVIAEVHNTGSGWARANASGTNYEIKRPDGTRLTVSQFPYAIPDYVAPGTAAYLFEDASLANAAVLDFATVSLVTKDFRSRNAPATTFAVGDIATKVGPSGGLLATGTITVSGPSVARAAVLVVCLTAKGDILGGTYSKDLTNLSAGAAVPFTTTIETPPMSAGECVSTVGMAVDRGPNVSD